MHRKTHIMFSSYKRPHFPDSTNIDEVTNAEYWADVYSGLVRPGDDPMEPVSDINYPVFDETSRIEQGDDNGNVNGTIVAVLSSAFYWRDILKNILPSRLQPVIVVIDNPCKAPFTYEVMYVFLYIIHHLL